MSLATELPESPEAVVIERRSMSGEVLGEVSLDPTIFSLKVNVPLLHQVITAQLAARRAGTHSTKTRAEVAGGAAKPFRQKGTGNARQGTIRAPHYAGGGVAFGPKPRNYAQRTPKKMVQQALRCALSDRAQAGELRLVDALSFSVPKTKDAIATLTALGCDGRILIVVPRDDNNTERSFRNLAHVVTLPPDQLTAYDVLGADVVVFTDETLPGTTTTVETKAAPRPRKAAATKAPATAVAESEGSESEVPETAAPASEVTATEAPAAKARVAKAPAAKAPVAKAPAAKAPARSRAAKALAEEEAAAPAAAETAAPETEAPETEVAAAEAVEEEK